MTKNKTVKKHDRLVSAGPHQSRGIPDARYLGIADRALNQREKEAEDFETVAGSTAHSSEKAPALKSNSKTQRDARFLLHYRQG